MNTTQTAYMLLGVTSQETIEPASGVLWTDEQSALDEQHKFDTQGIQTWISTVEYDVIDYWKSHSRLGLCTTCICGQL